MWPSWFDLSDFIVGAVFGVGVVLVLLVIVAERAERRLRPHGGWPKVRMR